MHSPYGTYDTRLYDTILMPLNFLLPSGDRPTTHGHLSCSGPLSTYCPRPCRHGPSPHLNFSYRPPSHLALTAFPLSPQSLQHNPSCPPYSTRCSAPHSSCCLRPFPLVCSSPMDLCDQWMRDAYHLLQCTSQSLHSWTEAASDSHNQMVLLQCESNRG